MSIPEVSYSIVFTMAEGDSPTSFSETDSDSVLSGSVCYSTELSEDDEVLSEASSMLDDTEVHPYLFEPERSSSESDAETLDIADSRESELETRTGTIKDLYVLLRYRTCFYRCTCNFCQPMPTARESICCQELGNIRDLLIGDPVPACITLHTDFNSACLCRAVLLIAYHGHRHHYGTSDVPTDENR